MQINCITGYIETKFWNKIKSAKRVTSDSPRLHDIETYFKNKFKDDGDSHKSELLVKAESSVSDKFNAILNDLPLNKVVGERTVIKLINKPYSLNIVYYVYMSKLYIFTNDL